MTNNEKNMTNNDRKPARIRTSKPYRMLVIVVAFLAMYQASLVHVQAQANLVQNGSFEVEYPAFEDGCGDGPFWRTVGYGCNPAGDRIPDWQETTAIPGAGVDLTIDCCGNDSGPAQDGSNFIDLVGLGLPGAIEQAVPTTAGGIYTLSFHYSTHAASFCTSGFATATAMAGSSALVVGATGGAPYAQASLAFTGAGSTTTISFAGNEPQPCGGVLIDNVSVEQVLPTTTNQCRNGGWRTFGVFRNQGDCVSFVATGGHNPPAGP